MRSISVVFLIAALGIIAPAQGAERYESPPANVDFSSKYEVLESSIIEPQDVCLNPRSEVGAAVAACTEKIESGIYPKRERAYVYMLRANAYAGQGDLEKALADFDQANALGGAPAWISAYRGHAYLNAGDYLSALASYDEALRLSPDEPRFLIARAYLLATAPDENVRNGMQALSDATAAFQLENRHPVVFLDTLAAAFAEIGDFHKAVELQQQAIELLPPDNEDGIEDYQSRLDLYLAGMPYRQNLGAGG